jgi:hypothetical protein
MEAGVQDGGPEEGVARAASAAETPLAKFPGPLRLYANKRFVQVLFWIFAGMEYILGKALLSGADRQHFAAQLIIFIALLWPLLLSAFIVLSRNALALDLDRDGFTINAYAWYRPRRYAWKDTGEIGTRSLGFMNFTSFADRVAGRQRMLPDTYGLRAEILAQLMRDWQERALAARA